MEEVKHLPTDVKDEVSHLSVVFIPRAWLLHVEIVEGLVGVEEVNGIADGRGVTDSGVGFKDASEGRRFEEASVEEIPLEVGEGKELFSGRHRESKTDNDPSFYRTRREKRFFYYSLLAIGEEMVSGGRNSVRTLRPLLAELFWDL